MGMDKTPTQSNRFMLASHDNHWALTHRQIKEIEGIHLGASPSKVEPAFELNCLPDCGLVSDQVALEVSSVE